MAKLFQERSYKTAILTVHAPGQHMWQSPDLGPTPGAPKQWKSDVHNKSQTLVSARSQLTNSREREL